MVYAIFFFIHSKHKINVISDFRYDFRIKIVGIDFKNILVLGKVSLRFRHRCLFGWAMGVLLI